MKINGDVKLLTPTVTVEAMLKEVKLLLDEYERKIKESEKNIFSSDHIK
jgi:hypothetical protein